MVLGGGVKTFLSKCKAALDQLRRGEERREEEEGEGNGREKGGWRKVG